MDKEIPKDYTAEEHLSQLYQYNQIMHYTTVFVFSSIGIGFLLHCLYALFNERSVSWPNYAAPISTLLFCLLYIFYWQWHFGMTIVIMTNMFMLFAIGVDDKVFWLDLFIMLYAAIMLFAYRIKSTLDAEAVEVHQFVRHIKHD